MMIAFLLPIKVVMLLGSSDTIRHLPEPFQAADKDLLILLMGITTLLLYGAMHLTQRLSDKASKIGVQTLLEKNQKLVLFENQNEIARSAYSRFAEGLAAINFSLFGLLFLSFIYSDVAMILALSLIIFISGLTIAKTRGTVKDKPEGLRATQMSHWLTDFCFMSVFVYIVLDFLYLYPPVFILAIVAIILTRVLLGRLQFALNQFIALVKQENKINALFFHHNSFRSKKRQTIDVWDTISSPTLKPWLKSVIGHDLQTDIKSITLEVRDSQIKDVALLIAILPDLNKSFLVKLFGPKADIKAIHEASLILEYSDKLPMPSLLTVTTFEQYHCHIFEVTDMCFNKSKIKDFASARNQLLLALAFVKLSDDFILQYGRSSPFLWDELSQELFHRLETVSSGRDFELLSELQTHVPRIVEILKSLPLTVSVPLNKEMVLYTDSGVPKLMDWTKWKITPLSAGQLSDTRQIHDSVSNKAKILAGRVSSQLGTSISPEDIELSSLLDNLLVKYEQQRHREIIEVLVPRIISNITRRDRAQVAPPTTLN